MSFTFEEYVVAVDELTVATREMVRIAETVEDASAIPEPLSSNAQAKAARLSERIAAEIPSGTPVDMLQDEWDFPSLQILRTRIGTMQMAADQPPRHVRDWAREVRLACEEFLRAFEQVKRTVDF